MMVRRCDVVGDQRLTTSPEYHLCKRRTFLTSTLNTLTERVIVQLVIDGTIQLSCQLSLGVDNVFQLSFA